MTFLLHFCYVFKTHYSVYMDGCMFSILFAYNIFTAQCLLQFYWFFWQWAKQNQIWIEKSIVFYSCFYDRLRFYFSSKRHISIIHATWKWIKCEQQLYAVWRFVEFVVKCNLYSKSTTSNFPYPSLNERICRCLAFIDLYWCWFCIDNSLNNSKNIELCHYWMKIDSMRRF